MKTIPLLLTMLGMMSGGCVIPNQNGDSLEEALTGTTPTTCAVVIGMENSRFAGSCPGAKYDSDRMFSLIKKYTQNTILLQDSNATRENVRHAISTSIEKSNSGLFILYYSGHGGSSPFPDTGIEEDDGKDEYLCLYDNYFRDNEIWALISKAKGRIFCVFDCCHSRSIFRNTNLTLTQVMPLSQTWWEDGGVSMQCWSGCPDDTYSYGSEYGGQMTNTILKYFKGSLTYDEIWNLVEKDSTLKMFEEVQRTKMGRDFGASKVFR